MAKWGKYAGATRDGKFSGTLISCAICGFTFRRQEMIKRDGVLVCRRYCDDDVVHEAKPKGNTFT